MKDEIVFVRSGESLLLHFARHLRFTSTSSDVKSIRIAVQVTSQRVRKIYCSIVILEEMVWKLIRNTVIICVYLLLYRKKVLHRHLLIVPCLKKVFSLIQVDGYHELRDISVKEASCAFFNIVPKKASSFFIFSDFYCLWQVSDVILLLFSYTNKDSAQSLYKLPPQTDESWSF